MVALKEGVAVWGWSSTELRNRAIHHDAAEDETDEQTADIFTKASLSKQKHWKFTSRLLNGHDDT